MMTFSIHLFIACYLLFAFCSPLYSGERENQLTRSVLEQVEYIARKTTTLETFGKGTLSQSSTILDLKESALPVLLKTLNDHKENWKVRYWITDILGYVEEKTKDKKPKITYPSISADRQVSKSKVVSTLLKIIRNDREHKLIRLRAVDSILEISKKDKNERNYLRRELKKIGTQVKQKEVRKKIQKVLLKV